MIVYKVGIKILYSPNFGIGCQKITKEQLESVVSVRPCVLDLITSHKEIDYAKSTGLITIKLGGGLQYGSGKDANNFDPDQAAGSRIFL